MVCQINIADPIPVPLGFVVGQMTLGKDILRVLKFSAEPSGRRSKACICGRSLAGFAGSNPAGVYLCFVSVVYCQVEVSKNDHSSQRSPTECGVSECDRGT